jgi:transposase
MPAARSIHLREEEDKQLREIEHQQGLGEKVRLRAKILRLSHSGLKAQAIASYTGRHVSTVLRDFERWEASGLEGLQDGCAPGRRSPLSEQERSFLREKLLEERSWTASQLAEAVNEKFKLRVNRESMRVCLHSMGYSWQRHRYVPVQKPEAEALAAKQAEFDSLKKELVKARSS